MSRGNSRFFTVFCEQAIIVGLHIAIHTACTANIETVNNLQRMCPFALSLFLAKLVGELPLCEMFSSVVSSQSM